MQTIYIDPKTSSIAEEVIEIIDKKIGVKLNQRKMIPLIFESGSNKIADLIMQNMAKKIEYGKENQ